MRPQGHVLVSAGLGSLFWAKSRDPRTMALSLAFGVLVDLDHFIDYWYFKRHISFDLQEFLHSRYWEGSKRLFILFHAFEYLPLVFLFWQAWKGRRWAVAATAAMSSHVLADHFINELRPFGYFIVYRAAKGFRSEELIDWAKVRRLKELRARRKQRAEEGRLSWPERAIALFV
jgi:membrane-bound metal-dependent hydrolase YbcI (DUF457 family)